MTPKEKAKDIIQKFIRYSEKDISGEYESYYLTKLSSAKQCALIAVDEILKLGLHEVGDYKDAQTSTDDFSSATWYISYWLEVKEEIEKL